MESLGRSVSRLRRGGYSRKSALILVSQMLNSGGNAIFLLIVSYKTVDSAFNIYALVQFAGTTLVTLGSAAYWRPGLLTRNSEQVIASPTQILSVVASGAVISGALLIFTVKPSVSWEDFLLIILMLTAPMSQAALRLRAIVDDRALLVVVADSAWLIFSVSLLLTSDSPSAVSLTAIWSAGAALASGVLLLGYRRKASVVSLSHSFSEGRYLLAAAAIGLAANWLSLIVVMQFFPGTAVGDYRLALTLLGPVLVIAATQDTHFMDQANLLRAGWRQGTVRTNLRKHAILATTLGLGYLLMGYTPLAVFAVNGGAVPWFFLAGLIAGVARAWNSPYSAALRVLLMSRVFLLVRLWQTTISLVALGVALIIWRSGNTGLTVFLLSTELVATVSYLLTFKYVIDRQEGR